jgi:hypothetical protein
MPFAEIEVADLRDVEEAPRALVTAVFQERLAVVKRSKFASAEESQLTYRQWLSETLLPGYLRSARSLPLWSLFSWQVVVNAGVTERSLGNRQST